MLALLLLACGPRTSPSPPPADTGADTGARDTAADTADSGGPTAPLTWPATMAAPDVSVEGCGSTEDMGNAIAGDGDLDGDGLPELAVGAPGHDEIGVDYGAVYVFLGRQLSGEVDVADAHAVIRATREPDAWGTTADVFGADVRWLGDLDGDGLDELGVWHGTARFSVFEGARIAAGGELDTGDAAARHEEADAVVVPWPDLDGDGLDDVALGLPWRGMNGNPGYRGTIALASGTALLDSALPTIKEVYGLDAEAHAGAGLASVEDRDADGLRDLAARLGDDLVVLGSATLTGPYTMYADDTVVARWTNWGGVEEVVELGDADGGGRADLAVWYGDGVVYGVRGEDDGGDLLAAPVIDCEYRCAGWGAGRDLDGDGARDLWVVRGGGAYGFSSRALLAGTLDEDAPLATVSQTLSATGITVAHATDGVWVGLDAYYVAGGGAARVQVSAGDAVTPDDADAAVITPWAGWEPEDPVFADLTGDGLEEMVFQDEDAAGIAVFDGARIAAGGSLGLCDADWRVERDLEPLAWLEDTDGDGADDVLLVDRTTGAFSVRGGPALLGLVDDDTRAVRTSASFDGGAWFAPLCDVSGDGRVDYAQYDGGAVEVIDGRAWVDGYSAEANLLGKIDADDSGLDWGPLFGCFDDLDGDGGEEVFVGYELLLSSALDPGVVFAAGDGHAQLERGATEDDDAFASYPAALGDLDGDGLSDHAFVTETDAVRGADQARVVLVPGAALAAGGALDAESFAAGLATGEPEDAYLYALGRVDYDGDGLRDLVLVWRDPSWLITVIGVPAADLLAGAARSPTDAPVLFAPGDVPYPRDGGLSLGPDYAGTGGVSIVVETEDPETEHRAVRLIFGR